MYELQFLTANPIRTTSLKKPLLGFWYSNSCRFVAKYISSDKVSSLALCTLMTKHSKNCLAIWASMCKLGQIQVPLISYTFGYHILIHHKHYSNLFSPTSQVIFPYIHEGWGRGIEFKQHSSRLVKRATYCNRRSSLAQSKQEIHKPHHSIQNQNLEYL